MTPTYTDGQGSPLRLAPGKPLGVGGEGRVCAVEGQPALVAKVYHQPPDPLRARKLSVMAGLGTPPLRAVCAWPQEVLLDGPQVAGLLLPRLDLTRARPIHDLTGPASRLRHFPEADYRFLVRAARNLAAAVATVHAHGQVIGDLNPSNVYVTQQATVTLIDTDSFQVTAAGERFPCPVGTPEFTPPELQGQDLSRTPRTPDHDAFGLATFIFQLLFLGQYPWAGVYADGRHMAMPEAIRAGHFAWGAGAARVGLRPPPGAPPLDSLPDELAELFEAAFSGQTPRPTAADWVAALDTLQAELVTCPLNAGHLHFRGRHCPWCAVEARTKAVFFPPRGQAVSAPAADLEALWREVEAVPPPPRVPLRLPPLAVPVTPRVRAVRRWISAVLALGLALSLVGLYHGLWLWAGLGLALSLLAFARSVTYRGERATLRQLHALHAGLAGLERDFTAGGAGGAPFAATLHELGQVRAQLRALPTRLAQREAEAQEAYARQRLHEYLEAQPLHPGAIPGIGEKRLLTLHAHGVATAADVEAGRLAAVPGVGGKTSRQLLAWRHALEGEFRARGPLALPANVRADLRRQSLAEARTLGERLRHGPAALRHTHLLAQQEHARVQQEVEARARTRELLIQML